MKKILVSVLAIAGLVACNNEDVVREQNLNEAITFDGIFVENATRANDPSIKTETIEEFFVWAYMNETTGYVFNDERVYRSGGSWTNDNLTYWLPGNHYYFAAFAGDRSDVKTLPTAMEKNGLGVVEFTNVEGTNDILYSEFDVFAENKEVGPVKLVFEHLLSKVKFTFANGFVNKNTTVVVKDIKMVAPAVATIDLSAEPIDETGAMAWTDHSGEVVLDFGDMNGAANLEVNAKASSDNERLTIPAGADKEYKITFDVEVFYGEKRGMTESMEVVLKGFEFVAGRAYNLVATINQENLDLNAIEFEVIVDEWIEQDVNGGAVEDEVRFVSTIDELQAILDAATGNTSVVLGADLQGNVTVPELAGATIAINGNGHNFDGTFALVGGSTYGEGTTIFEGINFKSSGLNGYDAFIYCNEQNGNTRYPDNVTIKGCTFEGTDAIVAAKFRSLKGNLVVENCEAKNMHSLLQLLSCGGATVVVDGVEAVDCGRGLSLQNSTNVIRNSNIVASSYGVRLEGGAAATTIENSTIEATQPVIVRKLTAAGYVVNVDAATALNTDELYQVVFTKGSDDAAYVAPEVDFTFNGPSTIAVFPSVQNASVVTTSDELVAAVNDGAKTVYMADGTYTLAKYPAGVKLVGRGDDVVLDVQGKKYGVYGDVAIENVKLVFSNANYTGFQHTGVEVYKNCTIVGQPFLYGNDVTFEGCTFEQTSAGAYNVWTYGAKNVEFVNCVFNCAGKSVLIYTESGDGQDVVFEGCTLNASAPADGKAAIEIDSSLIKGEYNVSIINTTANGFANGNVSGNSLWNNKKGDKTNITVDGVEVL